MNVYSLTAMAFLSVSGGPIGSENAMIGSDIYSVLCCLTWLFITYIIPLAYMTYEMSLHSKDFADGGPIGWVRQALGKRCGIANAVWDLIDTHIDNAIYPVLFADNVILMGVPEIWHSAVAWALIIFVFVINWGEIEGITSIILSIVILSPFVGLVAVTPWNSMWTYAAPAYTVESFQKTLTVLVWNINGFDMISPYAHKVKNPEESYFWATVINAIGCYLMMVIVFCLGSYYIHNPNEWVDGSYITIASSNGVFFKYWMFISVLASTAGTLTAEVCSTSYLYIGLSKLGFSKRFENNKFNLVINAIILGICVIVNVGTLIELSAVLNTLSLNFEVVSWIQLKGCSYLRMVFAIWIIINNLLVVACASVTCLISILSACGLAALVILLSERSISTYDIE